MKQFTFSVVLASLLVGITACQTPPPATTESTESNQAALPGKGVTARSAHSNWIEEHFQTEIVNIGLEKLGYRVAKPQEIDYPAIYLAIANGELDYSTINYEKTHLTILENSGGADKLEAVGVLTPDGRQGYQINKEVADEYNITNIEQLKDPKIAKLFDSDGDGKANLVGCNPGWGCELIIEHHLEAYGLQDTVEHDKGQYIALMADTITRYEQGANILYYAYNPHWVATTLKVDEDVLWLEVPFTSLPEEQGNLTEKDTSVDEKNLGFPTDRQRIIANKEFLAANPVAKRWFELVTIPAEDMNKESLRIKDGEDSAKDIRRHAEEWVEQNQELFDGWLEEAQAAGKAAFVDSE
ncbi:MAG: glycine betaine/L-proline ABC transporter substrate-binding protein ProX [Symploca sp. SIO3E6]|nr:glycine betaine/L-proline ABC transporter substrate-binding protein ProX [Caldora sp. SIO3E6]